MPIDFEGIPPEEQPALYDLLKQQAGYDRMTARVVEDATGALFGEIRVQEPEVLSLRWRGYDVRAFALDGQIFVKATKAVKDA